MGRVTRDEINAFKSEIPLVDYIQRTDQNYKILHAQSSAHTTYLENDVTGSKIAISKKNGQYIFKDWKAPVDKKGQGSIIDFVQEYQNKSYTDALYHLRETSGNIEPQKLAYNQVENRISEKKIKVSEDHFRYQKLKFTKYLNDRGISNDTINSKTFSGRVGQKEIKIKSGSSYHTTVFPMYDKVSGDLIGLEQKNNAFSGSYPGSNKKTGFFKSNVLENKPNLFISESPVDMMAHYQLHNQGNKQNLMYLGTYGELSKDRIETLNNYIQTREHKFGDKFILGMDNDIAGSRFNINLMGNVDFRETNKDVKFYIRSDKEIAKMSVTSKNKDLLKDIEERVLYIANNELKLTSNHELQYRSFSTSQKGDYYEMSFLMNNRRTNILPLEDVVKEFRNSRFEIERPKEKDFGIDLENKLGIIRDKEPVFNYPHGTIGYVQGPQKPIKVQVSIDKSDQSYTLFTRSDNQLGKSLNKLKISNTELKELSDKGNVKIKPFFKSVWKNKSTKFKSLSDGLER